MFVAVRCYVLVATVSFWAELAWGYCLPDVPQIVAGTIKLPRKLEIMPLSVFDNEVVGATLYSMVRGVSSSATLSLSLTELVLTRPSPEKLRIDLKSVSDGACVYEDIFSNDELDVSLGGDRAEFQVENSMTYLAFFSSNPSAYTWLLLCLQYEVGMRRCPASDLVLSLYTKENPPNNLNFETIGRDLRTRTCLTMEEIPGLYSFRFDQGNNTCPDDGV